MSVNAYKGLEASGLTKTYDDVAALDNLELIVRPGELVALVGSNGTGKSTFLRLAAGLLEPTDGDVWIDRYDAGTIAARAALSFVGDQPSLYGDLSVREHIEYLANAHEIDAWPAIADELLESLNLDERVDDLPVRFSRGLRQKTALVLALVRPFSVLVIDEPFVDLRLAHDNKDRLSRRHRFGDERAEAHYELRRARVEERFVSEPSQRVAHNHTPRTPRNPDQPMYRLGARRAIPEHRDDDGNGLWPTTSGAPIQR